MCEVVHGAKEDEQHASRAPAKANQGHQSAILGHFQLTLRLLPALREVGR
jgi:hypothetical protein